MTDSIKEQLQEIFSDDELAEMRRHVQLVRTSFVIVAQINRSYSEYECSQGDLRIPGAVDAAAKCAGGVFQRD